MALDTVGPNFSYLEGGVIIPQPDLLDLVIEQERRERQRDTRHRVDVTVPGLYDEPPAPPSRRPTYDDRMADGDNEDRGYCEFDM